MSVINLGKQGETNVRQVQLDVSRLVTLFGPGTVQLLHRRPGDVTPYPVALTRTGDVVTWVVTAADTAYSGEGQAELQYFAGDSLAKSETYTTTITASQGDAGATPPEPQAGWVAQVLQAGIDAAEAAERAENAVLQPPIIGENGNWWLWDFDAEVYVDSGAAALGGDADVTADNIKAALGYAPAKQTDVDRLSQEKADQVTASLGPELASASGWTLGAGWSGSLATGFTHASGNTADLTFMPSGGIKAGSLYQVTFKCNVAMTTSNLFLTVGNSARFDLYGDKMDSGEISIGVQAVDTSGLRFVPESSFTGTLTDISIKEISGGFEAVKQYFDTNNAVSMEIRITPQGLKNVFIGQGVGQKNTTGRYNIGIGADVLVANTSGFWNVGIGKDTLKSNIAGSRNIAIGYNALRDSKYGQRNVAIGTFAMTQMVDGEWNVAIGADSMNESTTGTKNVGVGFNTLVHNMADGNVAVGADAMQISTTGSENTAVGTGALANAVGAKQNVAVGYMALRANNNGNMNVAVGVNALYKANGNAQYNVAIGAAAGKSLTTAKRCIIIGALVDGEATIHDQLNIGNLLKGSLGNADATADPYLSVHGGLRLPSIPTASTSNTNEVWNNNGVLMIGSGGMDTLVQAVIQALPVYNGEVE